MATKICTNCNMPFNQVRNEEQCPACAASGDATFRRIKEYLYEHQGASASELVSVLGVSMRQIRQFLREDRLEVVGDGYSGLRCDKCGVNIKTGRYCESCGREEENRTKADSASAAKRTSSMNQDATKAKSSFRSRTNEGKGK